VVVRGGLNVLEECVMWGYVALDKAAEKRVPASDHSLVDVVDPLECPTRPLKESIAGANAIDDEGEAAGLQKPTAGEVGLVHSAEDAAPRNIR
jgi:hypothetical protein